MRDCHASCWMAKPGLLRLLALNHIQTMVARSCNWLQSCQPRENSVSKAYQTAKFDVFFAKKLKLLPWLVADGVKSLAMKPWAPANGRGSASLCRSWWDRHGKRRWDLLQIFTKESHRCCLEVPWVVVRLVSVCFGWLGLLTWFDWLMVGLLGWLDSS